MADFRGEAEIIWEEPIASCAPRKKKKKCSKNQIFGGKGAVCQRDTETKLKELTVATAETIRAAKSIT